MKRHIDSIKGPEKINPDSSFEETVAEKTAQSTIPDPEPAIEAIPAPTTPPDNDSFEALFPEPTVAISGPPGWIWWSILFVALGILGFVGYNLLKDRLPFSIAPTSTPTILTASTASPSSSPTPSATIVDTPPTATATPEPTATATPLNLSSITLRVLNGTSSAGAAGKAETILQKAGFTVRTIGNAKQQNYLSTFIYYQSGRKAEASAVQQALKSYSTTLEESSLANPDMVLVVIGQK